MKRIVLGFTLLILVSALISGCCERVTIFPVGAYVASIAGQEIVLDFERGGTYTAVLAGDKLLADSTYRVTTDTITFSADAACPNSATYSWARHDGTLTFEASGGDSCGQRREWLQDVVYECVSCP